MSENTLISLLDAARTREEQILILRKNHWTYRSIKQGLGVSLATISKALKQREPEAA